MKTVAHKPELDDRLNNLRWVLLVIVLMSEFVAINNGLISLAIYVLPTLFIFLHGSRFMGRKNILIFFITIFVVSYTAEYLGVSTGKIFGDYYYNAFNNGPLVAGVPPLLMLTYFAITYATYWVMRIILSDFGIIKGYKIFWFSLLGGLIATLTDLAADPVNSTVNKVYIWSRGGIFFGVPYLNFLGWLAEISIFFIILSCLFGYITKVPKTKFRPSISYQLQAVALFALPVIPIILRPLWGAQPQDIRSAMSLIALFGLGSIIVIATLKIFWKEQVG